MIAEIDEYDVFKAITESCPNTKMKAPLESRHTVYETCALCINGRVLTSEGMQLAALFAKASAK